MVQPFTEAARRSVVLAQQEARMLGSGQVGTDHLLLGLMGDGRSMAGDVLRGLGVEPPAIRREIQPPADPAPPGAELEFTGETRRVFELAFEEARRLGHGRIAPPHMLLGVIRHGGGTASRLLCRLQIDPMRVRAEVVSQLQRACPRCLDVAIREGARCTACGFRRRFLPQWAWVAAACLLALLAPIHEWLEGLAL